MPTGRFFEESKARSMVSVQNKSAWLGGHGPDHKEIGQSVGGGSDKGGGPQWITQI